MLTPSALLRLTPLALALVTPAPTPQAAVQGRPAATVQPAAQAAMGARPRIIAPNLPRTDLLLAGVPQGTFHLTGLVRKDKSIVLRWANTHGEMPTEGVRVYRQKDGDHGWKELKDNGPVGFYQGPAATKRLRNLPEEEKHRMLSLFHGTLQYDPATRMRLTRPPETGVRKVTDLTPDKVLTQYRTLRAQGRLAKSDLQMLHAQADMDPTTADILGLSYVDKPGSGQWRYKIAVKLPNGATAEALCDQLFNPSEPTPVPAAQNLAAKSGNGAVLLNWEAPVSKVVAGFNVYRAESATGPFHKLNTTPVKLVTVETEDPEVAMQKAIRQQDTLEKELKRNQGAALTPERIREIRTSAVEQAAAQGPAPLSPELSKSIKEAVASGRLPGAGRTVPTSAYADDRKTVGNGDLAYDKAYVYKITTVDIGGAETALDSAPVVSGTPRDLEAPAIPGRPHLYAHAAALAELGKAQNARLKDPQLSALDQTIAARTPTSERRLSPMLSTDPSAITTPPIAPSAPGGPSLSAAKQQRAYRALATIPAKELAQVAAASTVTSQADGSVAPAKLVWAPSPDGDLKSYEVYRADGKGPFQKLGSTAAPEWMDASLEVGHAYHYAITATDTHGNESAQSAEGNVEVCDSRLKDKLAVKTPKGQATTAIPTSVPVRSLLRPPTLALKPVGMESLKFNGVAMKLPKAASATSAPVAMTQPRTLAKTAPHGAGHTGARLAPKMSVKGTEVFSASTLTAKAEAPSSSIARKVVTVQHHRATGLMGLNMMLVEPAHPKAIHVLLEWDKPQVGSPVEYTVYQAAQKVTVKPSARETLKPVTFTPTPSLRSAQASSSALGAEKNLGAGAAKPSSGPSPKAPTSSVLQGKAPSMSERHLLATSRVAAMHGAGLVESLAKKNQVANMLLEVGPGDFAKVNDAPVTGERYAITFPVDVAQFGGASYYFRIQARTKEFGRIVEGPLSDWIEVRLPDVVPPPSPTNGALDLQEADAEHFNVGLTWTAVAAKDLDGTFVERQPMNFTLVDGEPQVGAAAGDPQRLTTKPVAGTAYTDLSAPGGYMRYTLRSADKTGNVSDPLGYMDVLVPGEPTPGAPTALAILGNQLQWKAGSFTAGFTVWRSFTGQDEDYECISGILGPNETSFTLPLKGTLHLKVVARSTTGMNQTASGAVLRTPTVDPSK